MKALADISSFESLMNNQGGVNSVFNKSYPRNTERGYVGRQYLRDLLSAAAGTAFPGAGIPIASYLLMKPTRTGFADGYSERGRLGRWWGSEWRSGLLSLLTGPFAPFIKPYFFAKTRLKRNKGRAAGEEAWMDYFKNNPEGLEDLDPRYMQSYGELRDDYEANKFDDDVYRQLLDRLFQDGELYRSEDYADPTKEVPSEYGGLPLLDVVKGLKKKDKSSFKKLFKEIRQDARERYLK